jgi:hypothetical protein
MRSTKHRDLTALISIGWLHLPRAGADHGGSPWCRVTTTGPKSQFRATMGVEAEDCGVFTPVACIPVE